jgi:hypothetical protein
VLLGELFFHRVRLWAELACVALADSQPKDQNVCDFRRSSAGDTSGTEGALFPTRLREIFGGRLTLAGVRFQARRWFIRAACSIRSALFGFLLGAPLLSERSLITELKHDVHRSR